MGLRNEKWTAGGGAAQSRIILCAEGKHQSPLDFVNSTLAKFPLITNEYYHTRDLNIRNTGHTVEVAYPEGSRIYIDSTAYQLLQFHSKRLSMITIDQYSR